MRCYNNDTIVNNNTKSELSELLITSDYQVQGYRAPV